MLSVLAKLSIVKHQNFGVRCFETLKDLMKSGRQMEEQVRSVLMQEVIGKIGTSRMADPAGLPVSLLVGLGELVEATGSPGMLTSLYDVSFPAWLRLYCQRLESYRAQGTLMGNDDLFDAIISLIATSVKDDEENVSLITERYRSDRAERDKGQEQNEFIANTIKVIKSSNWDHKRYIPCLKLIARLANVSQEAADIFVSSLVHTLLIEQITKSLNIYKKNNSLFDESSQETVEQQMLKYETLAAEITCLGGLLNSRSTNRDNILNKPVVLDLIQIMRHP